jgi:hypothetical protein
MELIINRLQSKIHQLGKQINDLDETIKYGMELVCISSGTNDEYIDIEILKLTIISLVEERNELVLKHNRYIFILNNLLSDLK